MNIIIGISGGIAAYKVPQLVRDLTLQGHQCQCVLTSGAEAFVSPMVLQALSQKPVRQARFDESAELAMGHIELARWADCILIAPATAQVVAALAQGQAYDLLTTLVLATKAPVVVAPAMNQAMWAHPAVQSNMTQLEALNYHIIAPGEGAQACGDVGPGRLAEPSQIFAMLDRLAVDTQNKQQETPPHSLDLQGLRVMITAGPTQEPIDPVRYLTNKSSGKMGYAIAANLVARGASVSLVSGPVHLDPPAGLAAFHPVTTALEMYDQVMTQVKGHDWFISTAAVADFRVANYSDHKIKKNQGLWQPELTENPDILKQVAAIDEGPICVGFAAESHPNLAQARDKMLNKGVQFLALNDVSRPDIGFSSDDNAITMLSLTESVAWPKASKHQIAERLISYIKDATGWKISN